MSLRKGPTRIPTFGSRIPLPGQNCPAKHQKAPNDTIILEEKDNSAVTIDLGRRVRVNHHEGVLRYIGKVHFAKGIWCGIEVAKNTGKNDGVVNGVRYFACPTSCGLMAPLSKVSLEESEDRSGPYSMLFGIENVNQKPKTITRSGTFDKLEPNDDTISNETLVADEQVNETILVNEKNHEQNPNETVVFLSRAGLLDETQTKLTRILDETQTKINDIYKQKRNFVLENLGDFESPINFFASKVKRSTPKSPRKNRIASPSHLEDDISKRDSLEFDESLGILTPDQMMDVNGLVDSRTPSSENIRLLSHDDLSPKLESSIKEFSLGLIDEHILSALTMKTDAMNLPLDSNKDTKDITIVRIEQTPSPEELPLDPTPIVDSKVDANKKPQNSFITSITSITSLDTGYQGDGEMSRPASRGADNSPLTRRPQTRAPPRRPDPMTDSDFYTESDADNHEEHPLRGDRRAQVIDGTLYGVDPQAAADIYANNRENMDSSGIFTDIERTDELSGADNDPIERVELSPSDSSTKTISDDSQSNINQIINKTPTNEPPRDKEAGSLKSPASSTPVSSRSPRHAGGVKDDPKKHKMPKRNVTSKVKAMIEPGNKENEKRTPPPKKVAGRWDAVMNKISKAPTEGKNLKEVKSKVFSSISSNVQRNEHTKTNTTSPKLPNNKIRRVRTRATTNTSPNKNAGSVNSSLSDLSGAFPPKKTNGPSKKQRGDVVRVAQVLTTAKLSPKLNHTINAEAKNKNNANLNNHGKPASRNLFGSKDNKKDPSKEIGRATVKGGRVSPATRPPPTPRAPLKPPAPRTAEALAVLVQHLVFNLEAFKNPGLKKEVERMRLDAEEARLSVRQLEETLTEEKLRHSDVVKDERIKYRGEINQLIEKQRNELIQLNLEQQENQKVLEDEKAAMKISLTKLHEDQLRSLKLEFDKLQKTHEEALDILREENDAIREEIDEKNAKIRELEFFRCESDKLRRDYEAKEVAYKERLNAAQGEIARLREENDALITNHCDDGGNSFQEVQSLRVVLELKQQEFQDLRKELAECSQRAQMLPAAEEKIAVLFAKCEDLQHQLERKNESALQLISENKKLQESFKEEANQKKRLYQHNEELQWKLQQNKEVVEKVIEEAEASAFNRSLMSASFNERHSTAILKPNFERTLSFRERSLSNKSNTSHCSRKSKNSTEIDFDDVSPPSSPKVKGVVEKSDSVSYVLEMDESPEVVASRIVRRSFRNATPPKNTPTKSPANKRPRMKNNLSLSASASAIVTTGKIEHLRSRSASVRSTEQIGEDIFVWHTPAASTPLQQKYETYWTPQGDFEEDLEDIKIPALPSEIGRKHASTLPVPKILAGEAMISESNSEDECSTSSSSGQL